MSQARGVWKTGAGRGRDMDIAVVANRAAALVRLAYCRNSGMNNAMISRSIFSVWLLATSGKGTQHRCTGDKTPPRFSFWHDPFGPSCGCAAFSLLKKLFLDHFFKKLPLISVHPACWFEDKAAVRSGCRQRGSGVWGPGRQPDARLCNQKSLSDQSRLANRVMAAEFKMAAKSIGSRLSAAPRCAVKLKELRLHASAARPHANDPGGLKMAADMMEIRVQVQFFSVFTFRHLQNHDLIFRFFF